jgi:hypothetical protein
VESNTRPRIVASLEACGLATTAPHEKANIPRIPISVRFRAHHVVARFPSQRRRGSNAATIK